MDGIESVKTGKKFVLVSDEMNSMQVLQCLDYLNFWSNDRNKILSNQFFILQLQFLAEA